jgi:hypothetical protein
MDIKRSLRWLVCTKLGWLIISAIWFSVFKLIDNSIESDWAFWVSMPAGLYILGLTLVMIAYGWIINPIREYKENKKFKEQNKDK